MVKSDVKTPIKRKSFGNDTPAKKPKIENGKNNEKTPKKNFQSPKNNQQAQKGFKKNKPDQAGSDAGAPKKITPFAGTKQLDKQQKKQKIPNKEGDGQLSDKKRKRRNQYDKLIANVKANSGNKDPEVLKTLDEKISAIKSRPEITKTAKRKLAVLQKLKVICEEGAEVAAAKAQARVAAEKAAAKGKTDKKAAPQQVGQGNKKKAAVKAAPVKVEAEDDEDSDEEEESDAEESGEEEEGESGEEEDDSDAETGEKNEEDSDEDDDDDAAEDDDDDDDSDVEAPAPKEKPPVKQAKTRQTDTTKGDKQKPQGQGKKQVDLDELKSTNLVTKGQKRFVLFVGNIPYDTTRQDLVSHFTKAGDILHVRLPTEKGSNKPRGFGYIEVQDEITYQKCLSMHHSQIKGRRINVLYTQGGKKKGEDKKKEIKVKNMKLHGLRTQGKLAGSVKQSQKRSFRRNKSKGPQIKSEN